MHLLDSLIGTGRREINLNLADQTMNPSGIAVTTH